MPSRLLAFATICVAIGGGVEVATAQPVADFYRGKTVTMMIGYPPAGANDVYTIYPLN